MGKSKKEVVFREKEKQELQAKWKKWFKEIREQLYQLKFSICIYKETTSICKYSEVAEIDLIFYRWLLFNYYDAIAMTVRRLADIFKNKKYETISFVILINDISDHSEALPENKQISKAELQQDLKKIKETAESITTAVDTKIAHIDYNNNIPDIESEQVDESLDKFSKFMGEMFEKYNELLDAHEEQLEHNLQSKPCGITISDWRDAIKRAFANNNNERK